MVFGCGDAVSREDHGARQFAGLREVEGHELLGKTQRSGVAVFGNLEVIGLAESGIGSDLKGLQVGGADGLDAELLVGALDERGRLLQLGAAGNTAAEFRGSEELDVVQVEIR